LVARRLVWLEQSIAAAVARHSKGVPLVSFRWPMLAFLTRAGRQGRRDAAQHLVEMGLWNRTRI